MDVADAAEVGVGGIGAGSRVAEGWMTVAVGGSGEGAGADSSAGPLLDRLDDNARARTPLLLLVFLCLVAALVVY